MTSAGMTAVTIPAVSVQRVLIATDFSRLSERALTYAMQLADFYDASLYVLHVAEPSPTRLPMMEFEFLPDDYRLKWGREQFDLLEKSAILAHYQHWFLLGAGEPSKVIHDAVAKNRIDLVVVGTYGNRGLAKVVMGSVAEEVFRDLRCPVLTVSRKVETPGRWRFERILFATDCRDGPNRALSYALSLARGGSELVMVHALNSGNWRPTEAFRRLRESEEQLKAMIPAEQAAALHLRVVVEFGSPADVVKRVAEQERVDLIVMGAHPSARRSATHLPWTVAHQVVQDAHCAVLTVRAAAKEEGAMQKLLDELRHD